MSKIINFNGNSSIEVNAGACMNVIGSVKNNILRNEQILPKEIPLEQKKDMETYHKRYSIAQGVDMILKRAEEDEDLKGKPIVIVVHPQQITPDEHFQADKLTTTLEVGTLVKVQVQTDTEIKIQ